MKIVTIDIIALEWFDKVNGNSYFSGTATTNFGMPDEREVKLPFQYGYGDHYKDMAMQALEDAGIITDREHYEHGGGERAHTYCSRKGIILRSVKHENCKKRELKSI